MTGPKLSIILPVHNQADHVRGVVQGFAEAVGSLGVSHELLLVPNGSRDDTDAVCRRLAEEVPNVRCVAIEGRGWGRAVRLGIQAARGEVICYTNSARTQPEDLNRIVGHALANPDQVVKASRVSRGKLVRRMGSVLYNLECRWFFGVHTRDVNGTPKVFPRRFGELAELTREDDLIDLEFLWQCRRGGYPVVEIAVREEGRHGGTSTTSLRSAWRMYIGAFRFWRAQGEANA